MTSTAFLIALAATLIAAPVAADPVPAYTLLKTTPLGAPDRWDYVVADADTGRVYVAHGDRVTVVDASTGAVVGQVEGMPGGTHGTAISVVTGQGFTDDGEKGEVVAFDLKTLKAGARIAAAVDADGMIRDPLTGHIFVVEGDSRTVGVIDPVARRAVATIDLGEKPEYLAADDAGHVYVAGEANSDLIAIDARTNRIATRWKTPDCVRPHGLAIDKARARLFMGCVNARMLVIDAHSGRIAASLPIGLGSDAVAFDPGRKRVFSSNGRDGTISVYQQVTPDRYLAMASLRTQVSGRTMAIDARSGRLFVAAADVDPTPQPGGRFRLRPGTLKLLMFDPVD